MVEASRELEKYREEFEQIEAEAHALLDRLSPAQLTWEPAPGVWSVSTCLDHVVVAGQQSLAFIAEAVAEAHRRRTYGAGPFRYGVIERWAVWLMGPDTRVKLRTPQAYRPRADRSPQIVVQEFFELQDQLKQSIEEANGLDLARVRVRNPVTRWMRFSLGQEYAMNAAHEKRHLQQIRRILHSEFR